MTDWSYKTVSEISGAIHSGETTSLEVLQFFLDRIDALNPKLNAVIARNRAISEAAARRADDEIAQGNIRGPLHGVPMTIKDSFELEGLPATAGAPRWKNNIPSRNADVVQRLLDAGVVPMGKTNVPYMTADWQSYNHIYGITNNPWDVTRTPGGSSGGAAAAVAAGLTPIEIGSDIGGSIRIPAHFCGVYGHKPSAGLISLRGHIPGPPGTMSEPDLAVPGPIARNTEDLELLFKQMIGPDPITARGLQVNLEECGFKKLSDFRVRAFFEHPLCPVDSTMLQGYHALVENLRSAGVQVDVGEPEELPFTAMYEIYLGLLGGQFANNLNSKQQLALKVMAPMIKRFHKLLGVGSSIDRYMHGMVMSHGEWLTLNEKRARARYAAQSFFGRYDVLLMPVSPTRAITHDTKTEFHRRTITVNGRRRPYTDFFPWIGMATALGLPASTVPINQFANGLPMNVQIVGGAYQDLLTLRFSALLEEITGGFQRPPLT